MVAEGEVQRGDNGLIRLIGTVRDDKRDDKGAGLITTVEHRNGKKDEVARDFNTGGFNNSILIGRRPGGYSFPDTIEAISVQECLTTFDVARKEERPSTCREPVQIWP